MCVCVCVRFGWVCTLHASQIHQILLLCTLPLSAFYLKHITESSASWQWFEGNFSDIQQTRISFNDDHLSAKITENINRTMLYYSVTFYYFLP